MAAACRRPGSLAKGACVALSLSVTPAWAQPRPPCASGIEVAATVVGVGGIVTVSRRAGEEVMLTVGSMLCYGDRIVTGEDANIEFRFDSANTTTGASSNTVILLPPSPEASYELAVVSGLIRFISSVRGYFEIQSPLVNAGIDGTEATIVVDGPLADTLVLVREGRMTTTDRRSPIVRVALDAGEAAYANNRTALVAATPATVPDKFLPFLLRPEDAADWTAYYAVGHLAAGVESPLVRRAAERLAAGDPDAAEALLTDARLAPRDRAAALAIRAVAAVFRNQNAAGLELARAAVAADPDLGATQVALSYALQAEGQVEAARDAAAVAVEAAPRDAYAWARLAELELTLGDYRRTQVALERSLAVHETALARAIEGFLALAGTRVERAEAAFDRAIAIDSNAPLPRLGLGLTKVRRGQLAEGRAEIETAVALDPRRASLRTWLGRAYFEENRLDKAAAQFALAQEEDPDDPTPYYFSALERFAVNDPIGALADINRAQELGERRGTQRGEVGLAEDRAARGAALGRVYDLLGFEQLATVVGARAVEDDATSAEAHYFLSDAFLGRQGFEVAQASEDMLAKIFSPPNRALIQPRLNQTDLGLLQATGPTRTTFAEFSPLIMGNGLSLGISGGAGTQGTYGIETSGALLEGPVSLAVGQFHFESDGFLPNNFVSHDIYALEARAALGPSLNLFTELRHRESEWGDRVIEFGNEIDPNLRQELQSDSVRAALHYKAAPGHDLVAVGTWADVDETVHDSETSVDIGLDPAGYGLEARYFGRFGRTRATVGGGLSRVDVDQTFRVAGIDIPLADNTFEYQGAFAYVTSEIFDGIEATLGLSVGDFEQSGFSASGVDPKFGLRVELAGNLELRAAYAETLQRPLILSQTVEPTTIAGFDQFFDDLGGAAAKLAAVGIDARPRSNLWTGALAMRRWIDAPFIPELFDNLSVDIVETRETTVGGYVNATFGDRWALALEARHELFQLEEEDPDLPDEVSTTFVPLSLRWFDPSGFFASIDAGYVHQSLTDSDDAPERRDEGFLLGGSLGYRLANGRGVIALEGRNLLDQELEVRDQIFNTPRTQRPQYARDLAVFLTGTFVW